MRVRIALLVVGLLVYGAAEVRAQQAQQPAPPATATDQATSQPNTQANSQGEAIRRTVNLVNVLFNVVNQHNKNVVDLAQADFKVFDDNTPQDIRFFSRQSDLPLRVGLLLDTSNSIRQRLKFEQEAAIDFLYDVIRQDKDQAFLMNVDDSPEVLQDFTGDLNRLRDVIQKLRAGGGTALYDAIYQATEHLSKRVTQPSDTPLEARGVLVVISDGDDNVSRHSRGEALEMAQRAGFVIYTISSSADWIVTDTQKKNDDSSIRRSFKNEGDRLLEQFADDSGGLAFFPYHIDDLAQSFTNIGEELRSQYSLGYVPSGRAADGRFHKIRIAVDVKGYKVQARSGYFADAAGTTETAPGTPSK